MKAITPTKKDFQSLKGNIGTDKIDFGGICRCSCTACSSCRCTPCKFMIGEELVTRD